MKLSRYAGANAELADIDNFNRNKNQNLISLSNTARYKCTICGQEVLTYVHAERHGYKSKAEMIKKGIAIQINGRKI